ncbi:MAG: DUF6541 family protein [Candidatus Dormibacteria bacterium]
MPLADFFRALPLVLLLGAVPGLALATLLAPRLSWPERLAAAPGFSVGCVGVTGLLLRLLGVPFTPVSVIPVLVVITVGALARHRLHKRGPAERRGVGWVVTGIAVATGAVLVGVAAVALRGDVLPAANDPAVHGAVAASIARDQDVLPIIPMPLDGSGYVRTQSAFEATDALALELGAGTPADLLVPLTTISLLVLPLSVAVLAFEAVPDRRVAAAAALLSLGLVFPASPIGFGDYPFIVDSTLVVPLILATARLLKGTGLLTESTLIAAAVLSIWVTHGLEIITAVAVGGAFWVGLLAARRRAALRAVCAGLAAAGAAAAAGYLITRSPTIPRSNIPAPAAYNQAAAYLSGHTGAGPASVLAVFTGTDLSALSAILLVVGLVTLILRRQARWLIVALAIPLLGILDVLGPELLHRLWIAIYPWSVEDRLLGLEFFVVPIIAAVGAVVVIDGVRRVMRGAPSLTGRALTVGLAATMALGAIAEGVAGSSTALAWQLGMNQHPSARDVAVMQSMAAALPRGTVVLNDGVSDDGEWITALTPDVAAEPKPFADTYPSDWRVMAMAAACTDPNQAQKALAGVQAVFVGTDQLPGVAHPWKAACIARIPGLQIIAGSSSGPAAFVVIAAQGS